MIIDGNSLVSISPSFYEQPEPDSAFRKEIIERKYPDMVNLLSCMAKKESTYCTAKEKGDNGLAWGCFQIHLDKHDITEWCVMDFECSLDWTVKKIKEGKGYLWTSYLPCL
jgi:hypothetical protein